MQMQGVLSNGKKQSSQFVCDNCPEVLLISFCHLFWCLLVFLKNSIKIIYLMFYTVFMFSSTLGEFVEQVRSNTKGK